MSEPIKPEPPPEDDFPEIWGEEPEDRPTHDPEPLSDPAPAIPSQPPL
jgi:hypothetical protein